MGVLRPSCWTKDQSNTFYASAVGYDHDADKLSGKSTELFVLLKGVADPNNLPKISWTVVATAPKAELSYPATEDCAVSPTGTFTSLQKFMDESQGNSTDARILGGFQYAPPSSTAASGTWSTILAGTIHKSANWNMFSVPAAAGSAEHAVVYARADLTGFSFSVLRPGQTSFVRSAQTWTWPDKQASNVYVKHGAGAFYGVMWAWKDYTPNPNGENWSYSFKVPFPTAEIPQLPPQLPYNNISLSGDCHYGNNTLVVVDQYFLFTCREGQLRHLYRFNGTGHDDRIDIDLRVAPQAFEGALGSDNRPVLLLSTKQGDKLDMFSYEGRNEKLSLPTVTQNLFYYALGEGGGSNDPSSPNGSGDANNGASAGNKTGISVGAIVGIIVGALVMVACVTFFAIRHVKKKKKRTTIAHREEKKEERKDESQNSNVQQPAGNAPYVAYPAANGKIPEEDPWHYSVVAHQQQPLSKQFYPQNDTGTFSTPSSGLLGSTAGSSSSPHLPPYIDPSSDSSSIKIPVVPKATRPRAPQAL